MNKNYCRQDWTKLKISFQIYSMYFDQILKNSGPSISTYIMRELAGWKMSIIEVCALEPVRSTTTRYIYFMGHSTTTWTKF